MYGQLVTEFASQCDDMRKRVQAGKIRAANTVNSPELSAVSKENALEICKQLVSEMTASSGLGNFNNTEYSYTEEKGLVEIRFTDALENGICIRKKNRKNGMHRNGSALSAEKDLPFALSLSAADFGTADFFMRLIESVGSWLTSFGERIIAAESIKKLNIQINELLSGELINFHIEWGIGPHLIFADDTGIAFGVYISELEDLLRKFCRILTDENLRALFVDTLKQCMKPYDLFFINNEVTEMLGIYSRKSLAARLRKVYSYSLAKLHTGCGYVHTKDYFAVIYAAAISKEDANYLPRSIYYVCRNNNASKIEIKQGKTMLAYTFIVKPVGTYNLPYDITLENVVNSGKFEAL